MSVLDLFAPRGIVAFAAGQETLPAVAVPGPPVTSAGALSDAILDFRAELVTQSAAMSIPAVRRAVHVIAGTISSFGLSLWQDGVRMDLRPDQAWLTQPDVAPAGRRGTTLARILRQTITDAIWHDRCVWQIVDRWPGTGHPARVVRVHPTRVQAIPAPNDPDTVAQLIVTGPDVAEADLILFEFSGTGGLQRYGWDLLELYLSLQAAALGYAKAPHPKAVLKNHGADLTDAEIEALLVKWENARSTRSVGYLNDVVDYETFGWNAQELQLVEAREYAALETARMFGLPARALDASTGDSMTYANVTEARSDLVESLRPWMTPVEQTLSMDQRLNGRAAGLYVPTGYAVRFDADAYTRDAPGTRMQTWQTAIASGVLTVAEARHWEPLASSQETT